MAEDAEAQSGEGEKPKSNKKKFILFGVLIVFLIGVSIGGTLFTVKMLTPKTEPVVELDEDGNPINPEEKEAEPIKLPAIYFPLNPPLIVNYQARGRQRFLQAEITIMAREADVIETVELHMPMIRNSLIMLFSGQVYAELQTEEGRELLRQEALIELQGIIEKELGKPGIEKVLFTNLVMQ